MPEAPPKRGELPRASRTVARFRGADGNLVTGQQNFSGTETAKLLLET